MLLYKLSASDRHIQIDINISIPRRNTFKALDSQKL